MKLTYSSTSTEEQIDERLDEVIHGVNVAVEQLNVLGRLARVVSNSNTDILTPSTITMLNIATTNCGSFLGLTGTNSLAIEALDIGTTVHVAMEGIVSWMSKLLDRIIAAFRYIGRQIRSLWAKDERLVTKATMVAKHQHEQVQNIVASSSTNVKFLEVAYIESNALKTALVQIGQRDITAETQSIIVYNITDNLYRYLFFLKEQVNFAVFATSTMNVIIQELQGTTAQIAQEAVHSKDFDVNSRGRNQTAANEAIGKIRKYIDDQLYPSLETQFKLMTSLNGLDIDPKEVFLLNSFTLDGFLYGMAACILARTNDAQPFPYLRYLNYNNNHALDAKLPYLSAEDLLLLSATNETYQATLSKHLVEFNQTNRIIEDKADSTNKLLEASMSTLKRLDHSGNTDALKHISEQLMSLSPFITDFTTLISFNDYTQKQFIRAATVFNDLVNENITYYTSNG